MQPSLLSAKIETSFPHIRYRFLSIVTGNRQDYVFYLIFLIAPSGSLRHSLAVLLMALGPDQQIEQFDTISAALQYEPKKPPELIVCDIARLDDVMLHELARLRSRWPHARLVTMIEDEKSAVSQADSVIVVTTGAAAARLRMILSNLLCEVRDMT